MTLNDLSTFVAWVVCSTAWGLLALSQERHRQRVWPEAGAWHSLAVARPVAFALLAVALVLCCRSQGPGFGTLLWVVVLCATAMLLALTLTWQPHWLRPAARLLRARLSAAAAPIEISQLHDAPPPSPPPSPTSGRGSRLLPLHRTRGRGQGA